MPKIATTTPKRLIRVIKKIGFVHIRTRGSHQIYGHIDGRRTIVPMHSREIPTGTFHAMLRDLEITLDQFSDLL